MSVIFNIEKIDDAIAITSHNLGETLQMWNNVDKNIEVITENSIRMKCTISGLHTASTEMCELVFYIPWTAQRSITANRRSLTVHIYHLMISVTSGFSKESFSSLLLLVPRNFFNDLELAFLELNHF